MRWSHALKVKPLPIARGKRWQRASEKGAFAISGLFCLETGGFLELSSSFDHAPMLFRLGHGSYLGTVPIMYRETSGLHSTCFPLCILVVRGTPHISLSTATNPSGHPDVDDTTESAKFCTVSGDVWTLILNRPILPSSHGHPGLARSSV